MCLCPDFCLFNGSCSYYHNKKEDDMDPKSNFKQNYKIGFNKKNGYETEVCINDQTVFSEQKDFDQIGKKCLSDHHINYRIIDIVEFCRILITELLLEIYSMDDKHCTDKAVQTTNLEEEIPKLSRRPTYQP